ncbi:energy transducer TonB [Variovorax sp. RO1]|uniref:energy transducer TonB n=1 Tax=Variovorax sp. RO1 TaxID=2066034 RepID=UPI0015E04A80|nr:energy transducer TonB [Variovorax sp. RO1]
MSWVLGGVCVVLAGCVVSPPSKVVEKALSAPEVFVPVAAPQPPQPMIDPPPLPPPSMIEPPPVPLAGPPMALPSGPTLMAAPRADPRVAADAVVKDPVIRQRRYPKYPPALAEEGIEGVVVTTFFVGVDGKPEDIRVERSPHPLLSRAATDAIKEWRFDPARTADGRAVRGAMRLPFRFRLD